MKILWVSNTIFPTLAKHLGTHPETSGSWMYALAQGIVKSDSVQLAVATFYTGDSLKTFFIEKIHFYLIPNSGKRDLHWQKIVQSFQPDLVHIHGTEYGYGNTLMTAFPQLKYIVSIQGISAINYRYAMAGIDPWYLLRHIRYWIFLSLLTYMHWNFYRRAISEKKCIERADLIIGRTEWDFAFIRSISPNLLYRHNDEILREAFYTDAIWQYGKCRPHSIFMSQGHYPIKGLHIVLRALALLVDDFPDISLQVSGDNMMSPTSKKDKFKYFGYAYYVQQIIQKFNLHNRVRFLGKLPADEMKSAYLRANVFVSASSIENGSNSIGEAQILGVPVIASFVGGVTTTLKDATSAEIYEFSAYEVLAEKIRKIFALKGHISTEEDRKLAGDRHSRSKNIQRQLEIYQEVLNSSS